MPSYLYVNKICCINEWVMSHIWISHVTNDADKLRHLCSRTCMWMNYVAYTNESCHTYEWVVLQMMRTSCVTCAVVPVYEWIILHEWMGNVTHMNESCPKWRGQSAWLMPSYLYVNELCCMDDCLMSNIWMSHVPNDADKLRDLCRRTCMWMSRCHTYESVMSHVWMSHVTHMNESCRTYEWVMSHTWMSHVARMNESCFIYTSHVTTDADIDHITHNHHMQRVMSHV